MSFPLKFDISIQTIFTISDKGTVAEIPLANQQRFDGLFFKGDAEYSGDCPEAVRSIKNAWMFMKIEDFIAQGNFKKEEFDPRNSGEPQAVIMSTLSWVDCIVIAERPL